MASWLIKSAVQRALWLLPGSHKWNEWFQEHFTRSLHITPGSFEDKLRFSRKYLDDFLQTRPDGAENFTALELGTGWHPIVPLALFLCGAAEVWSFDIQPLLRPARLKALLELFCEYDRNGKLKTFLPQLRPERMERVRELLARADHESPAALLERLRLHMLVRDAQATGLPPQSVDLFFSYSVLEYIPRAKLAAILAEFKRVGRPGAVMIHHIAMFDQFSRFDKSITELNYLKFTQAQWRWLQSPLNPLTRLRLPEYRALVAGAGFKIVRESTTSVRPEILDAIKIAPEFQKFSRDDLRIVTAWQVSQSALP